MNEIYLVLQKCDEVFISHVVEMGTKSSETIGQYVFLTVHG